MLGWIQLVYYVQITPLLLLWPDRISLTGDQPYIDLSPNAECSLVILKETELHMNRKIEQKTYLVFQDR